MRAIGIRQNVKSVSENYSRLTEPHLGRRRCFDVDIADLRMVCKAWPVMRNNTRACALTLDPKRLIMREASRVIHAGADIAEFRRSYLPPATTGMNY